MKLWKLTAPRSGWGTYDSAVVAAETEEAARCIHPNGKAEYDCEIGWAIKDEDGAWKEWTWADWPTFPAHVTATLIGDAAPGIEAGVIVASYNPE